MPEVNHRHRNLWRLVALGAGMALAGAGLAVGLPRGGKTATATDEKVKALLEPIRVKYSLPNLGAAILTSRGLQAEAVVGVRKAGTDIDATVKDKWHLGSDTKAMTAVLIARFVEERKLRWDESLEEIFPDIAPSMSPELRKVNILHLLSHRSGLPANIFWAGLPRTGTLREQRFEVVKKAAGLKLLSEPGSKYLYSNLGYVIAGAIAEKTGNAPWEELVVKKVCKPLGMKSVGFGGLGTKGKIDQPWPHGANGKPLPENGPGTDNPPVMGPAGTLHCTLADWAKFVTDQLRGARGEKALLKPESYKTLQTPPFGGDYALGWLVVDRPWGGGKVLAHNGSNNMNLAVAWVAPLKDFAVLIVTSEGVGGAATGCDEAAGALIKLQLGE